jgi:hypothetical protein
MKNSKEMAEAVFRIRDEYTEKKRRRNEAVKRAAFIGVPVFAAFALVIGLGAAFDRQEIGTDGMTGAETAPAATEFMEAEMIGAAPAKTYTVRETAVMSKAVKEETEPETSPDAEGEIPEVTIPETAVVTSQPEDSAVPAVTEETTSQPAVTTTTALSGDGAEIVAVQSYSPDEETQAAPDGLETVNEAALFRFNELCDLYPTLIIDREYVCTGETVAVDKLGDEIIEMEVEGVADCAEVYSLENGQIAVRFGETDLYIVYRAKED